MVSRYTGSGRNREGGFAAVHRQDFRAHTTGGDWRHGAEQIDMNPPLSVSNNAFNSATVQGTFEKMAALIDTIGQGFITIGDGYNLGDYNVDSGTTLQQAFTDAFANARLVNGGVVLVKAGTYRLSQTVQVPTGITIMGEPTGTYIFGSMNEQPMFRCAQSQKIFNIGTSGSTFDAENSADKIMFWNLVLGDNLDGYKQDGSNNAIATMSTVPMIQLVHGANVVVDNVTFLGRLTNNFPPTYTMTLRALGLDSTTTAPNHSTTLDVRNCYIDGVVQGIYFDVRNGYLDNLSLRNTRIRNYGSTTKETSSAVSFNLCNAHFEGNHHVVGGIGTASAGFYIRNDVVSNSNNINVNIINNSGGFNTAALAATDIDDFFINASSYNVQGLISGNSWGANNNGWFMILGDGTNSVGDITGSSAVDLALQISQISSTLTSHIDVFAIVNYGTYTVTAGGTSGKLNLLGKSRHGALPIIQLNSGSGTDEAGNKTTAFGNYIENIHFTTSGSTYNTVRINGGQTSTGSLDKIFNIKNCKFIDAGLIAQNPTRVTDTEFISYTLDNCKFSQSGAFADNFSFLLPEIANHILLNNVYVHDQGYAGGIGDVSGVYTTNSAIESTIVISNCIFNQDYAAAGSSTNAITAASPLTGMNVYFFINSPRGRVFIENSTFACADADSTATAASVIGGGLPAAGTFQRYIQLQARDITLTNTSVIAPNQRYTSSAVNYSMIGVWAEPVHMLNINGCKLKGSCALQISGTGQFTDITESAGIFISDSEIKGYPGASSTSSTALDIDGRVFSAGADRIVPKVSISNCHIDNKFSNTNTNAQVEHVNNTGSDYDSLSVVQIYANGWTVKVTNNAIDGKLGTNLPTGFTSLVGLFVDTLGSLIATLDDAFVMVANNTVKFDCNLSTASASDSAAVMWFEGVRLHVNNNAVHYRVTANTGSNGREYAILRTSVTKDDGSVIANNTFARSGGGTLNLAAITIVSLSGQGAIVDNDFDQATLDGSNTALFVDNTTPTWRKERNRNQTATLAITSFTGVQKIDGVSLGATTANNDFSPQESDGTMDYIVQVAGSGIQSLWGIDLTTVLPPDTFVISATADISFSGGTAGGNHFLELTSTSQNDASSASTPPGGTMTVTATSPTTNYRVNSTLRPFAWVLYNTTAAVSAVTASVTPIIVTFRW